MGAKMTSVSLMAITVERALSLYVQYVLSEFIPPRHHDDGGIREKQRAFFIKISSTPDDDLMKVPDAIRRVVKWLKEYDEMLMGMDSEKIHDITKSVEQLGSIFYIGRTFPDKAIKRAKALIPPPVKPAKPVQIKEKVEDANP